MMIELASICRCIFISLYPSLTFADITARLFDDSIEICKQFRDFVFTDWDKDSEVCYFSSI